MTRFFLEIDKNRCRFGLWRGSFKIGRFVLDARSLVKFVPWNRIWSVTGTIEEFEKNGSVGGTVGTAQVKGAADGATKRRRNTSRGKSGIYVGDI